jgi:hypothetical protein
LKKFWIRAWITVKNRSIYFTKTAKLDISRAITPIRVRRTTSSKLRLYELDLRIISASKSFSGSQEEDQNVES